MDFPGPGGTPGDGGVETASGTGLVEESLYPGCLRPVEAPGGFGISTGWWPSSIRSQGSSRRAGLGRDQALVTGQNLDPLLVVDLTAAAAALLGGRGGWVPGGTDGGRTPGRDFWRVP